MTDTYTKQRAAQIIRKTVEAIADMWVKGAPFDAGVWMRWNESLVQAIARRDLRTVERDCAKYQTWMAQQITRYALG